MAINLESLSSFIPKSLSFVTFLFFIAVILGDFAYRSTTNNSSDIKHKIELLTYHDSIQSVRLDRIEHNLDVASRVICDASQTRVTRLSGLKCTGN